MKHVTLAIATVMLPILSYAYKAIPVCSKTLKIDNVKLESSQNHYRDYCYIPIPAGTVRLVVHVGLDDRQPKPTIGLLEQMQSRLESGAPIYVVGGMVDAPKNKTSITLNTFDHIMCATIYLRNEPDQCRPLMWQNNTMAGTYDIQVVPCPQEGEYYFCFRNDGDLPECYATVEAVAILN